MAFLTGFTIFNQTNPTRPMKNLFLKLFSLAIVILVSVQVQAQEIALQMYSLRNEMKTNVKGTHALIPKMGINFIEGGGTYGMSQD